jgi:hypothetical protein
MLGEVRNDRVAKTAPAGRPKSDCVENQADKYGASMAAICATQVVTVANTRPHEGLILMRLRRVCVTRGDNARAIGEQQR